MKLLALSAAVGVALAQTPERCTYPQAFTARCKRELLLA